MKLKTKNTIIDIINVILFITLIVIFPFVCPELFDKEEDLYNSSNNENIISKENNDIENEIKEKEEVKKPNTQVIKEETIKEEPIKIIETETKPGVSVMSNNYLVKYNSLFVPDRYNTGINRNKKLTLYDINTIPSINGINFSLSKTQSGGVNYDAAVINKYKNKSLSGEYVIENYDFSNYVVRIYDFISYDSNFKIIFRNCKFGSINTPAELGNASVVFENCEFGHFAGSNATINNCKFGSSTGDAIVPFKNVYVNNSYVGDLTKFSTTGTHIDGVQIYAKEGIKATNIHFNNVRFDVPFILECVDGACSTSYVNAPIMLQLEFDDGDDITFENIYINGGGYSIYTHAVKGTSYSNVLFKNVYIGYGMLYGNIYPDVTKEGLTMTNVVNMKQLFIGSIWKDNNGVHISTTNYTLEKRELTCVTNVGIFTFEVNAHPKLTKKDSTNYTFNDMPYDINNIIKTNEITNIKCYDTTDIKELTNDNLLINYTFK